MQFKQVIRVIESDIERGRIERQQWDKYHAWYRGDFYETMGEFDRPDTPTGDNELTLETNYPLAFIDTMNANICPNNPQVTCNALDPDRYEAAKARQRFINEMLRRDVLKRKARRMSAFTAMCGRGVSRTTWSRRQRRTTTLVIDPRFFFYDMSAPTWDDVTYCFEVSAVRKDEFDKRVAAGKYALEAAAKVKADAYPEWMKDRHTSKSFLNKDNRDLFEWVIIYDFYDFVADQFYQIAESNKESPLFVGDLPNKYVRNPYRVMIFNEDLRLPGGISDIKLIEKQLSRLNELDTLELWHAHASIPIPMIDKKAFTSPEEAISMFANISGPRDVAAFEMADIGRPIDSAISFTRTPPMNPSWDKMRDRTESKVQFTLGISDYSRGVYGKGELATELALTDEATRTRNGWRIEVIQDWIVNVAKTSMAIWKQYMENDREMVIQPPGETDITRVNRATLAFPDPINGQLPDVDFDEDWFQYEAAPYSPAENTRLAKLQALQQFLPVLVNLPTVDKNKLTRVLLDAVGLDETALDTAGGQPVYPVQGQPGVQGAPGMSASPQVPPGTSPETEALLPPDVRTAGGASPPIVGG